MYFAIRVIVAPDFIVPKEMTQRTAGSSARQRPAALKGASRACRPCGPLPVPAQAVFYQTPARFLLETAVFYRDCFQLHFRMNHRRENRRPNAQP